MVYMHLDVMGKVKEITKHNLIIITLQYEM